MARKQFTCRICPDAPAFKSISLLRFHQRSEHADRWGQKATPIVEAEPITIEDATPILNVVERVSPASMVEMDAMRPHLEMALLGYKTERAKLDSQITSLTALLSPNGVSRSPSTPATKRPSKGKRHVSPEGRARIAEAQRKRWAAKGAS